MINSILYATVIPKLADTGIYETLAGIANTVTRSDFDENNEPYQKTFPASLQGVNRDFEILCPDNKKSSVAFFEGGDITFSDAENPRNTLFSFTVNFLAWYNLEKMGSGVVETGYLPIGVIIGTMQAINGQFDNVPFDGCTVEATCTTVSTEQPERIFSRYSFAENSAIFLAPYSAAVFSVTFKGQFVNKCAPTDFSGISCNII
jgi:hypothetical protein